MPLTLTLEGALGPNDPVTRTLSRGTLTLGRAPGNDWVLADPKRQLSKTHCVITAAGGRFVLTDLSTNGVFVNGASERVPRDGEVELADGDEFRLGDYMVRVAATAAAAAPRAGAAGFAPSPVQAGAPGADPFGADPLDSLGGRVGAGFVHPAAARQAPVQRKDDPFDFGEEPSAPGSGGTDDSFFRPPPPDPWPGAPQPDNVDAGHQSFVPARPIPVQKFDDVDFDALLGDTPPGEVPPPPPPPAPRAPAPPVAPRAMPPPVATAPPAASAAPRADAARLLAAFLEGAGVPGLATDPDPEATMRHAGAVFRAMVEGLRQVLISRAAVKNEFRVEQTMLRPRDNNPLKFSVSSEDAVAALLQAPRAGYKPPLEATREAFDDVGLHEMAVLAGVQTALMGLLRRFEPAALEKRLTPGMLANVLPAARKARTWELFCTTYDQIAREAKDDFQSVFGREFARAYDAQVRKP